MYNKVMDTIDMDPRLVSAIKEIRMKLLEGYDEFNAGMLNAILIIEEHIGEIKEE